MNALEKAKSNPKVTRLLSDVQSLIKVKFYKSKEDGWLVGLDNGVASIGYCECRHPASALAHELLHVKLRVRGFRQLAIGYSNVAQGDELVTVLECINNELQHIKIYDDFVALGLHQKTFYRDSDVSTVEEVRKEISVGTLTPLRVLVLFFTVHAPGGLVDQGERDELFGLLHCVSGGAYRNALYGIAKLLEQWRKDDSLDLEPYVKRIIHLIVPKSITWFGFDKCDRPPDRGFLCDTDLEQNVIQKFWTSLKE
ncbi:MAG: hypothetical protein Q7I92_06330 [Humidesulfovibrio sp.]|nr:hypothetical protein [Humidesulfovibrio sp.]